MDNKNETPKVEELEDNELDQVMGAEPGGTKGLVSPLGSKKVGFASYSPKTMLEGKTVVPSATPTTSTSGGAGGSIDGVVQEAQLGGDKSGGGNNSGGT